MSVTVVQSWSAAANTTHSYGATPTPGNTLLLAVNCDATVTTPSGWTLISSSISNCGLYLWGKIAGASEPTSVTVVPAIPTATVMALAEFDGITSLAPDVTPATSFGNSTSALSTGTTASTTQADTYTVGLIGLQAGVGVGGRLKSGNATAGFNEEIDMDTNLGSGVANVSLAVYTRVNIATGTQQVASTAYSDAAQTLVTTCNYCGLIAPFVTTPPVPGGWTLGSVMWGDD